MIRSDYSVTGRIPRQGLIRGQYDDEAARDAARLREVRERRERKANAENN